MIFNLHIHDKPEELIEIEQLQRLIWTSSELDIVPVHMLLAACHSGGLIIGAYPDTAPSTKPRELAGFVFGFPGIYKTPDGPRLKHHSHMLGVHPDYRNQGLGFKLKRAQWQMVRQQGIDRITWTYDPLLSPNAQLNIARLGAVCNTYLENFYGNLRDDLNRGLETDRFEVDWWVNTRRVEHRLSRQARAGLGLDHYLAAEINLLNPARFSADQFPLPGEASLPKGKNPVPLVLLEIPANFAAMCQVDPGLAQAWRIHTRQLFQTLFSQGYLVTDFVRDSKDPARSYYVLTHGDAQIGGVVY